MCRNSGSEDWRLWWQGLFAIVFTIVLTIGFYQTLIGIQKQKTAQEIIKAGGTSFDVMCMDASTLAEMSICRENPHDE